MIRTCVDYERYGHVMAMLPMYDETGEYVLTIYDDRAMERESILSTAMSDGLAFPHVRGVEGGGLTIALGVSKAGIVYDDSGTKVHFIFFSVIPVAVSAFYLRLLSGLTDAFAKKANRDMLAAAKTPTELWKALTKTTRTTIQ